MSVQDAIRADAERVSELVVLRRLRTRYGREYGNGMRWVFCTHVRDAAGFDGLRTADAVALDLWPSKGLELHGFEVKISRADWLRELKHPDKHRGVGRYCDRWWLVVPDRTIVRAGELPTDWGLIECREPKPIRDVPGMYDWQRERLLRDAEDAAVRTVRAAPKRSAEPLSRTFVAALMRAAVKSGRDDARRAG
jgi:hypothetical protein